MIFAPVVRAVRVVKVRVTGTPVLAAMRSPAVTAKVTEVGCDVIAPEAAPADAVTSSSVCTVMPVGLPAVTAPIVKPLRVMVKAVVAAMPATAVVMTMELPTMADVAVMAATDAVPAALFAGFVAAKNPAG